MVKNKVNESHGLDIVDQIVQDLGSGPEHLVATYQGFDISGYTFYTNQQDEKETFILATQATQVFHVKGRIGVDNPVNEEEYDLFDELPPFSISIPSSNDDVDDTTYLRSDNDEGLWIS
ncbi:hypothetical protein LXL04_029044 [Taraxacum kok-saghyz]